MAGMKMVTIPFHLHHCHGTGNTRRVFLVKPKSVRMLSCICSVSDSFDSAPNLSPFSANSDVNRDYGRICAVSILTKEVQSLTGKSFCSSVLHFVKYIVQFVGSRSLSILWRIWISPCTLLVPKDLGQATGWLDLRGSGPYVIWHTPSAEYSLPEDSAEKLKTAFSGLVG